MIKEYLKIKNKNNRKKRKKKKNTKTVITTHVKYNDNDNTIKWLYNRDVGKRSWIANRKSYIADRSASVPMTLSDLEWRDPRGPFFSRISVHIVVPFNLERPNLAW